MTGMVPSPHVMVQIDLQRVRANAQTVRRETGVPLIAVVKADAYGLGAQRVAEAIADLVDGFCTSTLNEAISARVERFGKSTLTIGPIAPDASAEQHLKYNVRPAVWDRETALRLRRAHPVLSIDTGMQRFACPREHVDTVLAAGEIHEALTHATRIEHVHRLLTIAGNRGLKLHAAGSALLHEPVARLDAVRPGLALYRGAARVSAQLVEARDSTGPAGYGGFIMPRHGVILAGYSNGLRPGPCAVNGTARRVIEVGMQSGFIELGAGDKVGDEVVLLGDDVHEDHVGASWETSPQQALVQLAAAGVRQYLT